MKKKILILSGAYLPKHVGGAEIAIKEITDRLPEDEYVFHMVTNRFDRALKERERVGSIGVHRIGIITKNPKMADLRKFPLHLNKLFFQWNAYRTAVKLHKRYHYDAIWAMMAHTSAIPAGLFKRKFPEVKYILTLQEGDPPEYIERKMRYFSPLFKRGFRSADIVQSISTFLSEWAKRMGYEGSRVVIPNAVNVAHFSKPIPPAELTSTKEELGKNEDTLFLITTSRLVPKNGIDVVIRALRRLPKRISFVVLGEGPEEHKLRALAKECGVHDRVQFRGSIANTDLPRYLQACDIFVRPSRSEGMGISFLEAMAARLPIIATREGGIADFLFDARGAERRRATGWVVGKDSEEDIVASVTHILTHKEVKDEVITRAYEMVKERYDWDLIAHRMEEQVFSHVLDDQN